MADLEEPAAVDATASVTASESTAMSAADAGVAPTAADVTAAPTDVDATAVPTALDATAAATANATAAATALDAAASASEVGDVEDLFADYDSEAEAAAAAAPAEQKADEAETIEADLEKLLEEEVAFEEGAAAEKPQKSTVEEELEKILLEEEEEAAKAKSQEVPEAEVASTPQKASPEKASPEKASPPKDDFVDESCYTRDPEGKMLLKWKVDYATRGGGGRAQCRDMDCLMRHEQGGAKTIEKGELRIGRRVLIEKEDTDGQLVIFWYHARCIFNTFLRARQNTRTIKAPEEIEGFADIDPADQELLRNIIAGNEDVRAANARTTGSRSTPAKRNAPVDIETPANKRLKIDMKDRAPLRKGDRVWTHCRVRPQAPEGAPPGAVLEVAIKSPKPELGMLIEEPQDGCAIVQFESAEHEKERLELFAKRKRLRAWTRYPRVFEGKKQRIPLNWIQHSRPPPKLCGCNKQAWSHYCDCGIACTRGATKKVFGVGQLAEREPALPQVQKKYY
eukprot:TRINITY_DN108569_c0_g1_i1.p1 TRINITY_DN108569_c0_g1~~TRINITY_DN108569_c0_g1_i1.p1  ORF type:complete len:520 (-),score=141.82 TRINITY_DN108569_c0_g1_i1:187-1719(-)